MEAPRSSWITGSDTFTVVKSMNAMLEPRIVGSKIQAPQ